MSSHVPFVVALKLHVSVDSSQYTYPGASPNISSQLDLAPVLAGPCVVVLPVPVAAVPDPVPTSDVEPVLVAAGSPPPVPPPPTVVSPPAGSEDEEAAGGASVVVPTSTVVPSLPMDAVLDSTKAKEGTSLEDMFHATPVHPRSMGRVQCRPRETSILTPCSS